MLLLSLRETIFRIRINFLLQFYLYFLSVLIDLIVGSLKRIPIHLLFLFLLLEVCTETLIFLLLLEIDCI